MVLLPDSDHKAAYRREVDGFLASGQAADLHVNDGLNFHRARPPTGLTAPLIDHLEERLGIAQAIQRRIRGPRQRPEPMLGDQNVREFRFDLMHMAAFLFADMGNLRILRSYSRTMLIDAIQTTEAFLATCEFYHGFPSFSVQFQCYLKCTHAYASSVLQRQDLKSQLPQPTQEIQEADDGGDDDPKDPSYQPNAGRNQESVTSVRRNNDERDKVRSTSRGPAHTHKSPLLPTP